MTEPPPYPDQSFLLNCRNAIWTMRRAGMNETLITCVIQDVRSATLNEEFRRIVNLVTYSPPHHHSFSDTSRGIAEWCKEEDPDNHGT